VSSRTNAARLLVVDDDRVLVDTLASWLESEGFEVRRAYDGLQGLAAASGHHPDLVLADVSMPGLDGVHLADRLREQGIPIILLSGSEAPRDLHPGIPFLAKPFDIEEIYQVIIRTIAQHQAANAPPNSR